MKIAYILTYGITGIWTLLMGWTLSFSKISFVQGVGSFLIVLIIFAYSISCFFYAFKQELINRYTNWALIFLYLFIALNLIPQFFAIRFYTPSQAQVNSMIILSILFCLSFVATLINSFLKYIKKYKEY